MITLQPGNKAPAFAGKNQNGERVSLKDFSGRRLALYFYPQDDTPTCTVQACNLRDNFSLLHSNGIAVVGVSPDEVNSHKAFEEKFNLPFPLIADPDHTIIDAYGVWGPKQLYGRAYEGLHRTTFLIDEKGKIVHIFKKPRNKDHAAEILKKFGV